MIIVASRSSGLNRTVNRLRIFVRLHHDEAGAFEQHLHGLLTAVPDDGTPAQIGLETYAQTVGPRKRGVRIGADRLAISHCQRQRPAVTRERKGAMS